MSLRPAAEKGDFTLVLAKRGTRAGVTHEVEQGAGVRDELVTEIPLRWSKDTIVVPGRSKPLRCIYWEAREPDADAKGAKTGRPRKHNFEKFAPAFPTDPAKAIGLSIAFREIKTKGYGEISRTSLDNLIDYAVEDGFLRRVSRDDARYYLAPAPK